MRHFPRVTLGATLLALAACDAPADPKPSATATADATASEAAPEPARPADAASGAVLTYDDIVAIVRNPDDFERARTLGALLPDLGPESVPAVKDALEEAGFLEMGAAEFGLLMRYWALQEPEEAAYYAMATAPRGYRVSATLAAVTHLATQDPKTARKVSAPFAMINNDYGAAAQMGLIRGWLASGEPGIPEYIYDLGVTIERERALRVYTTALARAEGGDAVIRWAESIPGDDVRYKTEVIQATGASLVAFDVAAAKRFCDAHCDRDDHGKFLRSRIATRWARIDPAAALDWLGEATRGDDSDFSVRVAYAIWARDDREAATRWLSERTADGIPDWLVSTIPVHAQALGKQERPLEGIEWASRIEDPDDRLAVTLDVVRTWRERDEAAAEAWMRQSSLPEEALERLRTPGRHWREANQKPARANAAAN